MKKIRADQIQVDQVVQFAGLTPGENGVMHAGTGNPKSFHPIGTVTAVFDYQTGDETKAIGVSTEKHELIMLAPNTKVLLVRE